MDVCRPFRERANFHRRESPTCPTNRPKALLRKGVSLVVIRDLFQKVIDHSHSGVPTTSCCRTGVHITVRCACTSLSMHH